MKRSRKGFLAAAALALTLLALTSVQQPDPRHFSLAGTWKVELDKENVGLREGWFKRDLRDSLELPGVLQAQGFGDEVTLDTPWTGQIVDRSFFTEDRYEKYRQPGQIKVPFWLQPEKFYKGAAWYQRSIEIPDGWAGQRVALKLERPHWETRVWIDDRFIGSNDSLSTPHDYTLGVGLEPGTHRLTIRVDNSVIVDVGVNSHSISDHTQSNWNGIVGEISLEATPAVWISDLQAFPSSRDKTVRVQGRVENAGAAPGSGSIRLSVAPGDTSSAAPDEGDPVITSVEWGALGGTFQASLEMPSEATPWDEFNPTLWRIKAELVDFEYSVETVFGLRDIGTEENQLLLNGKKLFLRGTLECAIFPKTAHPPTDVESWKKVIGAAKAHGLNHIRFHSWCPPEAAFSAADEMGFYFQVECGSWANQTTTLGDGKPVDDWIYREADRILAAYGSHPSFLLMLYGNEPGGDNQKRFLADWINHFRKQDPRRLYSSGSGWPEMPENEFHVTPDPRIQAWGQELKSRINALPPETTTDYRDYIDARGVPVISHEIGQWCVYPNFDEMAKYTGYLKPRNFEIFKETLAENHMLDQARDFLMASGKLQALCYKEDIESALRTPGMGGFQLLDLHDFPGQGTALVGVLDPFWEPKGYITSEEFKRFSGSTVPLARLRKRVFTLREELRASLEVAHFGNKPVDSAVVTWKIETAEGREIAGGTLDERDLPIGNGFQLGEIEVPLGSFAAPARYCLKVAIPSVQAENDWDFWVYPDEVVTTPPEGILVTRELDEKARQTLNDGGTVVWMIPPERVSDDPVRGRVGTGFSSIFWNTAWTNGQKPHTLGVLVDPKHPAFATFPTEYHSNWQWWYVIHNSQAMILDSLPREMHPVVQMIDDWFTNRRLGLVFEARAGKGRILVSSIDLMKGAQEDPVSRQLLSSLYAYAVGDDFKPEQEVSLEVLEKLSR